MVNKIFRFWVLSIFVMTIICFVGCKDDAVNDTTSTSSGFSDVVDSTDSDKDKTNSTDDVTSGIELEEDVFDDDNIVENTSSNNSTSDKPADKDNQSNNQSTDKGEGNTSSDKTESNSSDDVSDTESGDVSSDETPTESDDGTVKLPVDWF